MARPAAAYMKWKVSPVDRLALQVARGGSLTLKNARAPTIGRLPAALEEDGAGANTLFKGLNCHSMQGKLDWMDSRILKSSIREWV